jgi:hypothetical protein
MEDVMKRYLIAAAFACLLAFSGFFAFVDAAQQSGVADDEAAQITALQKERVEILQQVVKIYLHQLKTGAEPLESVAAAQNELIDAQLDATDKPEERVALLTEQLKIAENVSDYYDSRFKSGFKISAADVLRAKSHYLTVKIKLLRESSKLKPVAN